MNNNIKKYNNIFDCHAHYDDEKFDKDRNELLNSMTENGVCGIINNAVDIKSSKVAIEYSEKYPFMYAAIGCHPQEVENIPKNYISEMKKIVNHKKVVAIGEIGLDYYWDLPKKPQNKLFIEQLDFAKEVDLPVIIHNRDSHGDMMEILQKEKPKGVMHCFSGSVEMVREIVKLGIYISFCGVVTFKNARRSVEVAKEVPLDMLLLETDAPYLAPTPYRGKRSDSTMIPYAAEKIAEVKGLTTQEVLNIGKENAYKLFNIK